MKSLRQGRHDSKPLGESRSKADKLTKLNVAEVASDNFGNLGKFTLKMTGNELVVIRDGVVMESALVRDCHLPLLRRSSRKLLGLAALLTVADRMSESLGDSFSSNNTNYLQLISYHLRINDLFENPRNYLNLDGPKPEKELFRKRSVEEASVFLKRVYAKELAADSLYQHQLRKADPKLMQALSNEFAGRRDDLRKLVPPKKKETDKILRQAGLEPDSPVRRAMAATLRRQAGPK